MRGGFGEGVDPVGLLCTGDVAGVLFAGFCTAARLLAVLLVPWPDAGLVADGAGLLRGFAPVRPADWPGAASPALRIVPGDAAEE